MTIETINRPLYVTSDGQEFQFEEDAVEHDAVISNKENIELFLEDIGYADKTKAMLRVALLDYVKFVARKSYFEIEKDQAADFPSESTKEAVSK